MEIGINKDLRKYKSKDIMGFTFKQFGFLVLGLAAIILGYLLIGSLKVSIIFGIPFAILGFFEIKGMSVIQYLKFIGPERYLMKKQLIWMSDFRYDEKTAREIFGDDYEYLPLQSIVYEDEEKSPKNRGNKKHGKKRSR